MTLPEHRPAPNTHYLLINAFSTHPDSPLLRIARRITDSGCNLEDARLSTLGQDVIVASDQQTIQSAAAVYDNHLTFTQMSVITMTTVNAPMLEPQNRKAWRAV